jgi:hypothetical protein
LQQLLLVRRGKILDHEIAWEKNCIFETKKKGLGEKKGEERKKLKF